MAAELGTRRGPMADINVTPLIDVVLVLLVVFMVITPMLQSGMPVDLPAASQAVTENDHGQYIIVSVTMDKGVWVEQTQVSKTPEAEAQSIVDAVNKEFRENPSRSVMIKGDKRLDYGQVRKVMDALADQGMSTLLIAAAKE